MTGDHLRKCSKCGELKYRRFGGKIGSRPGNYWLDQYTENQWNGTTCPSCKWRAQNRKNGHRSFESFPESPAAVGTKYEEMAKKYFESLGAKVIHHRKQGPDLLVDWGMGPLTVEIKKISFRKGTVRPYVSRVMPKRLLDDLICYVFSESQIFVTSMASHLKHVGKNGKRTIYLEECGLSGLKYNYTR